MTRLRLLITSFACFRTWPPEVFGLYPHASLPAAVIDPTLEFGWGWLIGWGILAGGLIAVLGLNTDGKPIVGNFPCTGMHGGKVFLRSDCRDVLFPSQVTARPAAPEDLAELRPALEEFCRLFREEPERILDAPFTVVTPDSSTPYRQMYVAN